MTDSTVTEQMQTRFGVVAILGAPNAGKSTLTNQLVGTKVSIVSPKVQTTRARITGIFCHQQSQMLLLDTPGIFVNHKRRLEKAMVKSAWSSAEDADICMLVVDASARKLGEDARSIVDRLATTNIPRILVLNKVDMVRPEKLLTLTEQLSAACEFDQVFMVSALNGDGVDALKDHISNVAPEGPWHFPEDQLSDLPERMLAAEVVREKLFLNLHQELPYNLTVETESYKETKKGIRIEQVIYVTRTQHKAMVLGKNGQKVKQVSMAARKDLAEIYGVDVHLFLFVKVRENWLDDPERYREMGLSFEK